MQIKKVLEQYGLKERHSTIYLACLELGSASIQKIAIKSGFARSTCEAVLISLQEKGFVTAFKKKSIRYFSPEDPKKVIGLAKEKVNILENALPQFGALYYKGGTAPSARLYEGENGIRLVLREILDEARELMSFGSIDDIYQTIGDYFPKFTAERIKRTIPLKVILRDTPLARERQKLGPQELREVRLISAESDFSSVTFIWNNKLAMCSLKDKPIAFVIESDELSKIQKSMFHNIWENLEFKP